MRYENLSETVSVKTISENEREGVFEIEGLYAGYGTTIGNSLRRALFSSLPGAAITQVKVKGISHEFSTIPGVVEDAVEIMLNLKLVRFRIHTAEPQILTLTHEGEGEVTAAEIKTNSQIELITPDIRIATVSEKNAVFDIELTIERGLGYVPAEERHAEKLPIGVIALDAIFSPVTKVNFSVENMRVGDRTDYNRLKMAIETDGSITPSQAMKYAAGVLQEHFAKVGMVEVITPKPVQEEENEKKPVKKKTTKKSAKKKEE